MSWLRREHARGGRQLQLVAVSVLNTGEEARLLPGPQPGGLHGVQVQDQVHGSAARSELKHQPQPELQPSSHTFRPFTRPPHFSPAAHSVALHAQGCRCPCSLPLCPLSAASSPRLCPYRDLEPEFPLGLRVPVRAWEPETASR
eukprot:3612003-Rhodomonas_salina.1